MIWGTGVPEKTWSTELATAQLRAAEAVGVVKALAAHVLLATHRLAHRARQVGAAAVVAAALPPRGPAERDLSAASSTSSTPVPPTALWFSDGASGSGAGTVSDEGEGPVKPQTVADGPSPLPADSVLHAFSRDQLADLLTAAGANHGMATGVGRMDVVHTSSSGVGVLSKQGVGADRALEGGGGVGWDNATWVRWLPADAGAMRAALADFLQLYAYAG